jgi:hypothetical protein
VDAPAIQAAIDEWWTGLDAAGQPSTERIQFEHDPDISWLSALICRRAAGTDHVRVSLDGPSVVAVVVSVGAGATTVVWDPPRGGRDVSANGRTATQLIVAKAADDARVAARAAELAAMSPAQRALTEEGIAEARRALRTGR